MNLTQYRNNPIVQILREEGLSVVQAQQRINNEWNTPPEGYDISKISSVLDAYLKALHKEVATVVVLRKKAGIRCSYPYLKEALGVTLAEFNYLKNMDRKL